MTIKVVCDFRASFGPARDQNARPTCLAFAASDCHAGIRPGWTPLSCEFVFYHAQRRSGRSPHIGATLNAMLDTLREDGQPIEADWPYLNALPADLSTWSPPATVRVVFRRAAERRSDLVDEIVVQLDSGRPVLATMMLSDAFYTPNRDGVVMASAGEGPDPFRRHAVVAVGHGVRTGERLVLVRNSWGANWGIDGHAWLTEGFFAPRLMRVAILTEEVDVLAYPTAA